MSNITRWEPYREMATMRQMLDRFFDDDFAKFPTRRLLRIDNRDLTGALPTQQRSNRH